MVRHVRNYTRKNMMTDEMPNENGTQPTLTAEYSGVDLLRELMKKSGDNANSLAAKLDGRTSQPQLHKFLTGEAKEPRRATLQPVADFYGVPVNAFYGPVLNIASQKSQIELVCDHFGSQAILARMLGVAPPTVNQWVKGRRPVPAAFCILIEQASNGKFRRWSLSPDNWDRIWPELIGMPGAPEVNARAGISIHEDPSVIHSDSLLKPLHQAAMDAFREALLAGVVSDGKCVELLSMWVKAVEPPVQADFTAQQDSFILRIGEGNGRGVPDREYATLEAALQGFIEASDAQVMLGGTTLAARDPEASMAPVFADPSVEVLYWRMHAAQRQAVVPEQAPPVVTPDARASAPAPARRSRDDGAPRP